MGSHWRAAAAALDAGTAICAGLNSVYFLGRLLSGEDRRPGRPAAVGVLWLWSFATLVEAVALISIGFSAGHVPPFESPAWVTLRALSFCACLGVSTLIARKLAAR